MAPKGAAPASASVAGRAAAFPAPLSGLRPRRRAPTRSGIATSSLIALVTGALVYIIATDGGHKARIPDADAEFTDVARRIGLGIETVQLSGHRHTADREIYRALQLERNPLLIGFDAAAARRRVEKLPWIRKATVTRVFPNGLRIEVSERQPFAVWRTTEAVYLIDRTGRTLGPAPQNYPPGLPVVSGVDAGNRAREILDLVSSQAGLSNRITEAQLVGGRRWTLVLADGPRLRLPADGAASALAAFMARSDRPELLAPAIAYVDLRRRNGLVVKVAAGRGPAVARAGG